MARTTTPLAGRPDQGRVVVAAAFALTMSLYLPTIGSYHAVWVAQPNTHGYLIAAGTIWLLWQERSAFQTANAWAWPLLIVAGCSVAWLLARVANAQGVSQAVLPILAVAWCAAVFGRDALRRIAPIGAVFLLAAPIWGMASVPLRYLTITVSYGLLGPLRVPAVIDGTAIHVRDGIFIIQDACAGLNYFMAGIAVGGLYAVAFVHNWRTRLQVVVLAAGLSIVANWIRVTSLIVIGHVSRMEASIIYDHGTFGWVTFVACALVPFFPLARLVETRARSAAQSPSATLADVSAPSIVRRSIPASWKPAVTASVVASAGPLIYFAVAALPEVQAAAPLLVPGPTWVRVEVSDSRPSEWRPGFLGTSARDATVWFSRDRQVLVDRLEYRGQRQGAELIGFGNQIAPDSTTLAARLFGPVGPERRYVNEAIVRDADALRLVWYWYSVGGVETSSRLNAKLLEIPAFFRRATTSHLVAVSAACAANTCEGAGTVLTAFFEGGSGGT